MNRTQKLLLSARDLARDSVEDADTCIATIEKVENSSLDEATKKERIATLTELAERCFETAKQMIEICDAILYGDEDQLVETRAKLKKHGGK